MQLEKQVKEVNMEVTVQQQQQQTSFAIYMSYI